LGFVVLVIVKGRMGHLIAQEAAQQQVLAAGTVRDGDRDTGRTLAQVGLGNFRDGPVNSDLNMIVKELRAQDENESYVMIDFTAPNAMLDHLEWAATHNVAIVIGTTPLEESHQAAINKAAEKIPVLYAANTSLGANLQHWITQKVAHAMPDAEIEIMEIHHSRKKDAPSGTAKWLAEGICEASDRGPLVTNRSEATGLRKHKEVGMTALRGGDVPGEHTAYFFLHGERIEISHRAQNRMIFAQGAVAAARFLAGKNAGRYGMDDVLGLS